MKRLSVLLALLLTVPALSARKNRFPNEETLEFHQPLLVIGNKSVQAQIPFTMYGKLGGNQAWHHFTVTLALEADTTVSTLILKNTLRSKRRERRILREQGEKKQTGKFKAGNKKVQELSFNTRIRYRRWMQEPLVVIVRQYHSNKFDEPATVQPEQILKPILVEELPVHPNALW